MTKKKKCDLLDRRIVLHKHDASLIIIVSLSLSLFLSLSLSLYLQKIRTSLYLMAIKCIQHDIFDRQFVSGNRERAPIVSLDSSSSKRITRIIERSLLILIVIHDHYRRLEYREISQSSSLRVI